MKSFLYGLRGLITVLMMLLGAFMTLMGVLGLIYGEFHGPANTIFNLVVGTAMTLGGWKLVPGEESNLQNRTYQEPCRGAWQGIEWRGNCL